MPYSQRFVVSVLVDGQIQKERPDGSVTIPFGVEYALKFRNKHRDRRAVVKLFIDGEEQSKGGYVIPPSSTKVIERNSHSPRKFKFVAPTSVEAQDHGKDRNNTEGYNGVIEARFYLEKERPKVEIVHHHHHHHHPVRRRTPWEGPVPYYGYEAGPMKGGSGIGGSSAGGQHTNSTVSVKNAGLDYLSSPADSVRCSDAASASLNCDAGGATMDFYGLESHRVTSAAPATVAGVTVEGSHSHQTFMAVSVDLEEDFVPIKVLLKGFHQREVLPPPMYDYEVGVAEVTSKKA